MQAHVCGKYSPRNRLLSLENFKLNGDYLCKFLHTLFEEKENKKQDKSLADYYEDFFIISQNVAICPKTFSTRTDSYYKWHAGVTSSDVSPIKVQSLLSVYDHCNYCTVLDKTQLLGLQGNTA